jgi:hypothetical protein
MFLGLVTLLTALVISSVAVYYSVSGLAAIFAGASLPIIIMGASLEIGKLVTASWLHVNWNRAPFVLKTYLSIATLILMMITSMGIFGFLSRAHVEQGAPVGDVAALIEVIDEKINSKRVEIEQARTAIKNLDDVVAQYMTKGKDEKSVAAANSARRNQQTERNKNTKIIDDAQKEITKLQEQKLPLTQQVRKIETEVGPIKYLAAFLYGNNPNKDLLEKAVTWMIMTIIFVFDPLAVLLLIAGQMSIMQSNERRRIKKEEKIKKDIPAPAVATDTVPLTTIIQPEIVEKEPTTQSEPETPLPIDQWNQMISEAEKAAEAEKKVKPTKTKREIKVKKEKVTEAVEEKTVNTEEALQTPSNQISDPIVEEPKKKEYYMVKQDKQQMKLEKK